MRAKFKLVCAVVAIIVILNLCSCSCQTQKRKKKGTRLFGLDPLDSGMTSSAGLWPGVFNVAKKATITSNATCGDLGKEEYCRLPEQHRSRPKARAPACGICDPSSTDPDKHHPPSRVLDGTARWWQSPSLRHGDKFHRVTLTLDLGQIYQIAYVIVRAANSPRPAAWVLERSLDGIEYAPWQFFASSDEECWRRYGLEATPGKPRHRTHSEVICTAYYSKIQPLENGEIHVSLLNDKPQGTSPVAEEFAMARYVRLRFQRMRTLSAGKWLRRAASERPKGNTHYYSIREIDIGGQCVCGGHANRCRHDVATGHPVCECLHNTCGANCDHCCPMYNQLPYKRGTISNANACERCECNGHATSCIYDEEIDALSGSLDINGKFRGGGVCVDCGKNTTGINCERCLPGYYRPFGRDPSHDAPCLPCDCNARGSTGICGFDETNPKICECKPGFEGPRCDHCAPGYRGANCRLCPCDVRGSLPGSECELECQCKANVEGIHCDTCKMGYFALHEAHKDGCLPCFCSGVGSSCRSADLNISVVSTLDGWRLTDAAAASIVSPFSNEETGDIVAVDEELIGMDPYYWIAPRIYNGNLLTSYGSIMVAHLSWLIMRGDTSGRVTAGSDAILFGTNGQILQYGPYSHDGENVTLSIPLKEEFWLHSDGRLVTHIEFMAILKDVKHLLIRAKFHTDQAECIIKKFILQRGNNYTKTKDIGLIERCDCPPGYAGLSCEECSYGHVISNEGRCERCDCNNHSPSCDNDSGKCHQCDHNTIGEKCERCAPGYYGNPLNGTVDDCKKCACPLHEPDNNFSPSCQQDGAGGYICTQCPEGYIGDHCEICDDGYYGSPLLSGSTCEKCDCGLDTPCDPVTGDCLACEFGTTGRHCERCEPGSFGDPGLNISCTPCLCYENGTVGTLTEQNEIICNTLTGECDCNERFTGRDCDICQIGYGDITKDCPPCSCNSVGSVNGTCDPITGACDCKPGVGGMSCDTCLDLYYDFSEEGCKGCSCDKLGSITERCDIVTGSCNCKTNVAHPKCRSCKLGYWGIRSGMGCTSCNCDPMGSLDGSCDQYTGQCLCKPSVTGLRCDSCAPGYYGLTANGCSMCDRCDKEGHICDPDTGRCVCPRLSTGPKCEQCYENAWNQQPGRGCTECKCHVAGSLSSKCDQVTGQCECKPGFTGKRCDECALYYYGLPYCKRCQCDLAGTDPQHCNNTSGQCECSSTGQCPCKESTEGTKCNSCKDNAFGMNPLNPNGCTTCFCFGRTTKCSQAQLTWGQIRLVSEITLKIDHLRSVTNAAHQLVYYEILNKQNRIEKIILPRLPAVTGLTFVPNRTVALGINFEFHHPIYFQLPERFLGDKVLSYGGSLEFEFDVNKDNQTNKKFDQHLLAKYPLALIGHDMLMLEYVDNTANHTENFKIVLHESYWRVREDPKNKVTRELMMIVLQKITIFIVRATTYTDFNEIILRDVSMDNAILVADPPILGNPALGIEKCDCPSHYEGSSCQNPTAGYYRHKSSDPAASLIHKYVGVAKKCNCNGRSNTCDRETGHCTNCAFNSGGQHCQHCAEGFFGNPGREGCQACRCPDENRNHAKSCNITYPSQELKCVCKEGYTGTKCNECKSGYFGNPNQVGGECKKCDCEPYGSTGSDCDPTTGICICKKGLTGPRCDTCVAARHEFVHDICQPCDNCTQTLLSDLDKLFEELEIGTNHTSQPILPPWSMLFDFANKTKIFEKQLAKLNNDSQLLVLNDNKYEDLENQIKDSVKLANHNLTIIKNISDLAENVKDEALSFWSYDLEPAINDMHTTIESLKQFLALAPDIDARDVLQNLTVTLQQIKNITLDGKEDRAKKQLDDCQTLLDFINLMLPSWSEDKMALDESTKRLEDINKKIIEFRMLMRNITQSEQDIKNKAESLQNSLRIFKENVEEIIKQARELQVPFYLNITFDEYETRLELWYIEWSKLKNELLEKESSLSRLGPEYDSIYVNPSIEHALKLKEDAERIANTFNISENTIKAVDASSAYHRIVEYINDAKENLKLTNENIMRLDLILNLSDPPKPIDLSREIKAKSEQLQTQADIMSNQIKALMDRLRERTTETNTLRQRLNTYEEEIKNINNALNQIENKDRDDIISAEMEASSAADTVNSLISRKMVKVNEILLNISEVLDPKLSNYSNIYSQLNNGSSKFNKDLEESKRNLPEVKNKLENLESELEQSENTKRSISIQDLRNLIEFSRQIADGIAVSLTREQGQDEPCQREFALPFLTSSSTNLIEFYISVPPNITDSGLIYILGANKEFIAIELIEASIHVKWDLGGGSNITSSTLMLVGSTDDDESGWYKVAVRRLSNHMHLTVHKHNADRSHETSAKTIETYTILDLEKERSNLWVGGFPVEMLNGREIDKMPSGLGLQARIDQLKLDDTPVGLWNFINTKHSKCAAARVGPRSTSATHHFFNGYGYSNPESIKPSIKNDFQIRFDLSTLDSDALVFLADERSKNRTMALTLEDGYMVYEIRYTNENILRIKSLERVNNGYPVHVVAVRSFTALNTTETALLELNSTLVKQEHPPSPITNESFVPNIYQSQLYLGGVPPNFIQKLDNKIVTDSLLGNIDGVQSISGTIDPLSNLFYGVEIVHDSQMKNITSLGFHNSGYLELKSLPLRNENKLEIGFRSTKSNALLMLNIVFDNQSNEVTEENTNVVGFYSISLSEGKIMFTINTNVPASFGNHTVMISNETYNDGEFHVINILKNERQFTLIIDDIPQAQVIMKKPNKKKLEIKTNAGMYFGGVPLKLVNLTNNNGIENRPFVGAIKQVLIDNGLLIFNKPVSYENVRIGRLGPDLNLNNEQSTQPVMQPVFAPPRTCTKIGGYSFEKDSAQFGDGADSFAEVHLSEEKVWKKEYSIEFDFRTFYPNGLLYATLPKNSRHRHHLVLSLENGQLVLQARASKNRSLLQLPATRLNDGKWHHVQLFVSAPRGGERSSRNVELSESNSLMFLNTSIPVEDDNRILKVFDTDVKDIKTKRQSKQDGRKKNRKGKKGKNAKTSVDETKGPRKATLSVDGTTSAQANLPGNIKLAPILYAGGLPDKGHSLPKNMTQKLGGLKGCIRSFKINDKIIDLVGSRKFKNVRQCFPNIERGSYFAGDSYAVYDREFVVNKLLELQLEFRTSASSGVLLSIADQTGKPALSLEVNNSKIIMSVDSGKGPVLTLERDVPLMCDNKWHNISALYDSEELSIRIDKLLPKTVVRAPRNHNMPMFKGPLYIGGLPDDATKGSLGTRDNFNGCIRNIALERPIKDWTDMDSLHNVLLDSCPLH